MDYLHRVADTLLQERLEAMGAVLVEGPKWCGKTTTSSQQAKSIIRMQDTNLREQYLMTAASHPSFLLEGETPRLIDEWQDAPVLWDAVRAECDKRGGMPGQFILTGSNAVDEQHILHSGTGRITRMKMYPMSLFESLESNGSVSFLHLFDHPTAPVVCHSDLTMENLIFAACRGGWPASLMGASDRARLFVAKDYVRSVYESDISRVDGVKRNPKLAKQILHSYARNISTLAKTTSILQDVIAGGDMECSRPTFDSYVEALERLFVITDIDAWCPAVRSKSAIQSGPKRAFVDPSIAVALLGMSPEGMKTDFKTFGFIFEQLCIRDLRAYSQPLGGSVSYYHDRYGLEADIVLHLEDGRYALVECKLGSAEIEEGAQHLCELRDLIIEYNKTEKQVPLRVPDLLIVLTGGEYGVTRPDGVHIIPIGCLKS